MTMFLLRPYAILPWLVYRAVAAGCSCCCRKLGAGQAPDSKLGAGQARLGEQMERRLLTEPACYDWILTDLSVVLALFLMFCVIAPIIVFSALPFFWGYMAMVRYNIIFVYAQDFDAGGRFFFGLAGFFW